MSFFTKYRAYILGGILVVIAFFAYQYLFVSTPQPSLSVTTVASTTAADQDLIGLLSTLRGITLDQSIFADPSFQSLADFSRELVPEPAGRQNPFGPLGNAPAGTAQKPVVGR